MTIEGVLLDLSGVVYDGEQVISGSLSAISKLRAANFEIRFVTNTTRTPKKAICTKLAMMGLTLEERELFTPVEAARAWLIDNNCVPSELLVHSALSSAFTDLPDGDARAVVVGDAGDEFNYAGMNRAFRALLEGSELLALAKNRMFKDKDGRLSLDAGPFVQALEFASGKSALLLGKPSQDFFASALASIPCPLQRAVMVGDDADADVAGARTAGLGCALLVRTGKYRAGDERRFTPSPTAMVADLSEAADWILAHRLQN
jgi:HAD superfamily hydrolase (TIGR01458 family)